MIKIEYYGMDGQGRTVTEAKKAAGEKIKDALERIGQVHLVTVGGQQAIVFGTKTGWASVTMSGRKDGCLYGSSHIGGDLKDAITEAKQHLAQQTWTEEMGESHPDLSDKENRNLKSWFEFQLRYSYAKKTLGYGDHDAHDYAGRNPARRDVWESK